MTFFYLLLGIALLAIALVDVLWTTLWVDGSAGPVSARITTWSWRGLMALVGHSRHRALSISGPLILFSTVATWVLVLWAGWVFIFAGDEQSLTSTRDHTPADWTGRIYFVGYTIFTMGNGDFSPNGEAWQIATALANGSGMFLVTLAITYLISVVSAVVQKRAFASQVLGMGMTAEDFVAASWDGHDFRALDLPLNSLSSALGTLNEQYLAYPVLQYYHAAKPAKSPVIAVVVLDEALSILRYGVPEGARPSRASFRPRDGAQLSRHHCVRIHPCGSRSAAPAGSADTAGEGHPRGGR